jgi:threonine dehydrogenase-like Zn-dependent dehydrogenase
VGTGGVGGAVLQFAKSFGAAPIIAVDVSNDKLEKAKLLGAHYTVNAKECDPIKRIMEITGGGVDVSFEVLGIQDTFWTAVHSVRENGRAVIIGIPPSGTKVELDYDRLVRKRIHV